MREVKHNWAPCAVYNCPNKALNRVVVKRQIGRSATSIAFYYYCDQHQQPSEKENERAKSI